MSGLLSPADGMAIDGHGNGAPSVTAGASGDGAGLVNADLAPTTKSQRTWRWNHFASLWIGVVVCIPAYMVAGGLADQGFSPLQAILLVFLGNAIVVVPVLLLSHPGTRYGIPFAILARAAFGVRGAALPAMARALVGCGWFGIQTWIGGNAALTLMSLVLGHKLDANPLPILGISLPQLLAFLGFWAIQLLFVAKGMSAVRRLETWTAPIKIVACVALLWWAMSHLGGVGTLLSEPSQFVPGGRLEGQFWKVFWPSLTAMIGFWTTLALSSSDFTRFAASQKDQIVGQALGLPVPMALLAIVSVITTSATVLIYGKALWDPIALAGNFTGITVLVCLLVISIDTVCANTAANLVGPAYDFSSLAPRRIGRREGAYLTAFIGMIIMPWKLVADSNGFIFVWLVGYSSLLGPIAGVIIAEYWFVSRRKLAVDDLYVRGGSYEYRGGWNPVALLALACGALPNLPGFLFAVGPAVFPDPGGFLRELYSHGWLFGVLMAGSVYVLGVTNGWFRKR
ncbi:NCS1 family nucleobase:cation symporter-1 [Novosphingobium panipatense]|uniref:Nucleobase:cation symporter-1, NCS1 family n=1 Tax=Novosphingobium panipatense TaxID=428991 RepID=A0ABY1QYL0_9SPHN|nr:NCS1 family nucleobase:cation symporter-1 [Novosphingobium panipatense]SMP82539.1 nucleobase:cation symporter-1, NCS1 family [Novosphingobium panipatense]